MSTKKVDPNVELLRAGAYLLPSVKFKDKVLADNIDARIYTHEALGERTVVRLTPQSLASGEDNAMSFLGFEAPRVEPEIAQRARQALGFPEWVLVYDAKNAAKALEVSKKLKKSARRAKSKPGFAKEEFDAVADELAKKYPQFLPSYYEEVARAFLESGNTTYAASAFGKARKAEQVYALKVDEERRREAYLEFALVGALTNKVMTEYAGDLTTRHGAPKAYDYFFDLAVRRTLGGTPPHAQMIAQLRKIAKAAKLKPAEEDERFVTEIWDAPAVNKAPKKFWDVYQKTYIKMAQTMPELRGKLLNTFPSPSGKADGFKTIWLEFLEKAGAMAPLYGEEVESAARVQGSVSEWFSKLLHHNMSGGYYWNRSAAPDEMFALLRRIAPTLKLEGIPVKFHGDGYYSKPDVELIDLALELGLEVAPILYGFDLKAWAAPAEDSRERPRDLQYVGANELFDQAMDNAVSDVFGNADFQRAAHGCAGLESARRKWLTNRATEFGEGCLPLLTDHIQQLVQQTSAATFSEFPETYATLAKSDPLPSLLRTFNVGLLDELAWPAFEEAYAELKGKGDPDIQFNGRFPYLVMSNPHKAIVVNHAGRVMEHDFQMPKGTSSSNYYRTDVYAQGQILVMFNDSNWERQAYWSGNPKHVFKLPAPPSGSLGVELDDGSITSGCRALRAGDETPANVGDNLLSDGETFWVKKGWAEDSTATEYDPKTGKQGRVSLPKFLEDWADSEKRIAVHSSELYPLPKGLKKSVLGSKDGLYGARMRTDLKGGNWESERIDGWRHPNQSASAGVTLPGDAKPRPLNGQQVLTLDGKHVADNRYSIHLGTLPVLMWHNFTTRDEAGSKFLRSMSEDMARALFAPALVVALSEVITSFNGSYDYLAGQLERAKDAFVSQTDSATSKNFAPTLESYLAWLKGGEPPAVCDAKILNEVLRDVMPKVKDSFILSVSSVLNRAAGEVVSFGEMMTRHHPDNAGKTSDLDLLDGDFFQVFDSFNQRSYGSGGSPLAPQLETLVNFLMHGEVTGQPNALNPSIKSLIGRSGAIAFYLTASGTSPEKKKVLRDYLRCSADIGFHALAGKTRIYDAQGSKDVYGKGEFWLQTQGSNRYIITKGYSWGDHAQISVVEYSPTSEFVNPPGTVSIDHLRVTSQGWGSPEEVEGFLAALETQDSVTFNRDSVERLAEETGLTYAAAALVWAGMPDFHTYEKNFLDKELRTTLGLKVTEASAGKTMLGTLSYLQRFEVYNRAIPADPALLFEAEYSEQGGVATLVAAWNAVVGKKTPLPEDVITMMGKELERVDKDLLAGILAPEGTAYLKDVKCTIEYKDDAFRLVSDGQGFSTENLRSGIQGIRYLFGALPVGSKSRDALPEFYKRLEARLSNEDLIFDLPRLYFEDGKQAEHQKNVLDMVGVIKKSNGHEYADNGVVIAIPGDWAMPIYVRPAPILAGKTSPIFESSELGYWTGAKKGLLHFMSEDLKALVARVEDTPVPEGSYESNPLLSTPDTVTAVGKKHDLSEDESVLYLQILALHNPTTKRVRIWNDWTAGRYNKAAQGLTEKGLLIEAKRARAGRKHFLPGSWDELSKPDLPIETWKQSLYGEQDMRFGQILPLKPIHQTFEEAWARVEAGDVPKF